MNVQRHTWYRDPDDDEIDVFAHEVETETRGHNGPRCTVCGFFFCEHCWREGWDHECPGPAPEGFEYDWVGDGTGRRPETPELFPAR